MNIYVSNPKINLRDKFILSFDVSFSNKNEVLGFGLDDTKRTKTTVNSLDSFFSSYISRCVIIDNGTSILSKSNKYTSDGKYIWRKDKSNTDLLNLELRIKNDRVFEEVKNIASYDPQVDTAVYVENQKLFKHVPEKYVIENNIIKLDLSKIQLTSIFSVEKGKVKIEEYILTDNLKEFKSKLRFLTSNAGGTFNVGKLVGDSYEQIGTYFFSGALNDGYAFLYLDGVTPSNISVTYC